MPPLLPAPESSLRHDLVAGAVVFVVALPLCLGIAFASGAPLSAGLISGVIGGILVGAISRSKTSVSGPAAGLTAIAATQIQLLGSFQAFLCSVMIAGGFQVLLGLARFGFVAAFFPSSVIKGLLAAIGVILILKQIPHVLGHDTDPEGEMSFDQPDHETTFSEFGEILADFHPGAALIGVLSLGLLVFWDYFKPLRQSIVPAALVVVLLGIGLGEWMDRQGPAWMIGPSHRVQVPVAKSLLEFPQLFAHPDFSQLFRPEVLHAAFIIAFVASLETLLNLEAIDRLDPSQRTSPPNRELIAQGIGNMTAGLLGGIPITSVIIRSSVSINAGARTNLATIVHGVLLLICIALVPGLLNRIPISCLAAILFVTGYKLTSPAMIRQIWNQGPVQFLPFIATVVAIVRTDLLVGTVVGLAVSIGFIVHSNLRRPLWSFREKRLTGDVVRIELANQVSFLNRVMLTRQLEQIPAGTNLVFDARNTIFIDPDILDLIENFSQRTGPVRGIRVGLVGFEGRFGLADQNSDFDNSNSELQSKLTPADVLRKLKEGNERFRTGQRLSRDLSREVETTAAGQFPLAAIVSCIDSRSPAELVFDLGLGDIFSVRVAGHVIREKVLGSLEYACAVAKTKLIVVMGHTKCGAVNASIDLHFAKKTAREATGCENLDVLVSEIQKSIDGKPFPTNPAERADYCDRIVRRNVERSICVIRERSRLLDRMASDGEILIVGGVYDVRTGYMEFLPPYDAPLELEVNYAQDNA